MSDEMTDATPTYTGIITDVLSAIPMWPVYLVLGVFLIAIAYVDYTGQVTSYIISRHTDAAIELLGAAICGKRFLREVFQ